MTIDELIEHMKIGREIEFAYNGHPFFIGLDHSDGCDSVQYYLYDEKIKQAIAIGTIDDILSFEFQPQITFRENIEQFDFEYIL